MSYLRAGPPNGSSGYMNGDNSRLQRFDFEITPETSADERSRSRGPPGAYAPTQTSGGRDAIHGLPRLDRQHAHRRSRGGQDDWSQSQSHSRSRSGVGARYGMAGTKIDEILRYIEQQWSFMATDSCVPVKVALQLMDPSSLGLADQHDQFRQAHEQLQDALRIIVNEHHQGFNSSIGTFHKIQAAIHASQHRVRALRAGLLKAKTSLASTRPELKAFATSSQSYDQMLQILNTIETLRSIPDTLEVQISEKRFLGAVATLQEALALIRKPELDEIGALAELKVYLSNQEHSLTDILIEELHSHLYLKSPYTEERWKVHMNYDATTGPMSKEAATVSDQERAVHRFLEAYDGSKRMQEDPSRNPEAGTFYYIQLLVESLYAMGKLGVAVDAIEQRLPIELFRVVERSHVEVEQRHPHSRAMSTRAREMQEQGVLSSQGPDAERKATLEDLLTTLFAKFEAIAEGHGVLHAVTAAILKRDEVTDAAALNRSFRELWKLLQSEIRSLLHDHLATSGNLSGQNSRSANDPSLNIFRAQPRDRSRKVFKLSDTNSKATDIVTEQEDLELILKTSVPGLVDSQTVDKAKRDRDAADNMLSDRSAAGHKLLVEPSVFNMSILLPPSLAFLSRLKQLIPPNSTVVPSTLTSFLDDFLINVFYPQLEETLIELCARATNDLEAFQPDPGSTQKYAARTIFKGTTRFFELIEAFCVLLDSLPHEQSFSQLVIDQMRRYYDKCYQWSKGLLQRSMATENEQAAVKMRLAADLAVEGNLNDIVAKLLQHDQTERSPDNDKACLALADQESSFLIRMVKGRRLDEADLINDRRALSALCTLHVSMKWLAARCASLRYISPRAVDMANAPTPQPRRWTTNANLTSTPPHAYLPLDQHTAGQLDAVLASYVELSAQVLRTLHVDLRLQLVHGVYKAMEATYALGQPYHDPDPAVLALSSALGAYDATLKAHLLPRQHAFLTANLHVLLNEGFCALVSAVPAMDAFGLARMELNVVVVQQALKNVQSDGTLEKALRFYGLASVGASEIVKRGPSLGYDRGELKALLRLCWDAKRDGRVGSVDELAGKLDS